MIQLDELGTYLGQSSLLESNLAEGHIIWDALTAPTLPAKAPQLYTGANLLELSRQRRTLHNLN